MSVKLEGKNCALCHSYLFDDDDIVYCPICGAPHHRSCYESLGHCALEEFHGTDKQYDLLKKQEENGNENSKNLKNNSSADTDSSLTTCGMCHEKYDKNLRACPKCGSPNLSKMGANFIQYDFLGGVPSDLDIGDGVTADEAKRFVASNTVRYIPKFAMLNKANKASWNWMAFFFPCGWMLSRKMFKKGIIAGILTVISTLLTIPFNNVIYSLGLTDAKGYAELINNITDNISKIGAAVIVVAIAGLLLNITIRILSALFGDYFYKEYCINSIKEIKKTAEDIDVSYRKKGGLNLLLFMLGILLVQYLPLIIFMFI